MSVKTFVETLSSCLDVGSINRYFINNRKMTEKILHAMRPEGMIDGNRFKLASIDGGQGKSWDFNLENGQWGDWGKGNSQGGVGLVSFVCGAQRCSASQAVKYLVDMEWLDQKGAKKTLQADDGDPLVFPIPENHQSWDYVREQQFIKKDRGLILEDNLWKYLDTDGTLLGYKYRIDDRRNSKEIYTLTYRAESEWGKKAWDKKHIPPYGLEQLGDGTPTVRIMFVEGERSKDAAKRIFGDRWKVLSFSGVTASNALWLPDDEFWGDCEVVIWPDNDEAGRDSARKIQLLLQGLTNKPREIRIVRVETFAGLPPKWDLADYKEGDAIDPKVEVERAEEVDSFETASREWVYVSQPDKFYNLEDRSLIFSIGAFDRTYTRYKTKEQPSARFLADLNSTIVSDLDFVPGEKAIITAPTGKKFLNEWYATANYAEAVRIANDDSISDEEVAQNARYFIQHLERVTGGEVVEPDWDFAIDGPDESTRGRTAFDALAWHFSELVKRPMDKRGWIPMLVSEQNGTGKTYFMNMMQAVMGATRSRTITVSELLGDYDDWSDGILFYELGEVKSHESTEVYEELKKRHSFKPFSYEQLKDRTQNTQLLNIKTKGMKNQRDFVNGCVTSNDLFPLALANTSGTEGSDRRLYVINPTVVLTQRQTEELFDEELRHRAMWIGAWLMRYKAEFKWNPSWAPITAHKRVMLEKDRTRSENRTDKYELGRFDTFYHVVRWAISEGIGAMSKPVFSAEQIRLICEANRTLFPFDTAKFEAILKKANVFKGPMIRQQNRNHQLYTSDAAWVERPKADWTKAYSESVNNRDDSDAI
jgi:hypothetical protein